METTLEIKIFISCPGDVTKEKDAVKTVCHSLENIMVKHEKSIRLHVHDWRDIVSDYDQRPQDVVNSVFNEYDIYIGILHMRFGTPTGKVNPTTGKNFESGTEEEFYLAVDKKRIEEKNIEIFLFFKEPMRAPKTKQESEQLTKVLEFQEKIASSGWINKFRDNEFSDPIHALLLDYVFKIEKNQRIQLKKELLVKVEESQTKSKVSIKFHNSGIPKIDFYIPRLIKPLIELNKLNNDLFRTDKNYFPLSQVVLTSKRVVLLGNAGSGKSLELFQTVREYENNEKWPLVPIYKRLNTYAGEDFEDFLPGEWRQIPEEILLIVLDGLDEMQSQYFNTAVAKIISYVDNHKNVHCIVSSRTNFYELPSNSTSGTLTNFEVYFLEEVNLNDVKNYVNNTHQIDGEKFIKQAYEEGFIDLITRPFFLNIMIRQFKEMGNNTHSKAKIIEDYILSRIELDKEHFKQTVNIDYKKDQIVKVLEKVALIMESLGKNYVTEYELLKIAGSVENIEMIKHCTAFGKEKGKNDVWMFEHNNIQEYLAASALAKSTFESVKKHVSFPPFYTKIKPNWVNTLSFFVSISSKEKADDIVEWISRNEFEVIIKFESDRIDANTRFDLFKRIFNFYKDKDTRIYSNKFDSRELARFSQSEKSIDFLISELKSDNTLTVKLNAINLLESYDLRAITPYHKEKLKALYVEIILNTNNE